MTRKFRRVYIEISNICNLQCSFCPEVERQKKVMSLEQFKIITEQVQSLTEEITLHQMGEPLTHPQFEEFVEHCGSIGLPINLTTNGTMLRNKNRMETLLSPALRQVNFSLQSFTDNFPKGDVNEYLQTIFQFTRLAFERRPDLYINYRLWNMGSAEELLSKNAHFLEPISKEFDFVLREPVDVSRWKSRKIQGRLYLHFDSRFEWPSLKLPVRSKRGTCHAVKDHVAIQADGTVVPCCLDKEAAIKLGVVSREVGVSCATATSGVGSTFADIISSSRAQSMRRGFELSELREDLCQRCPFVTRFDRKVRKSD